ncbi:plasmid partitioning protein RepB C-terminal domain-containing protein [Piscinibacter gummiphilus]|uniref:Plasmid partitioning protein RepB C-terminal domain-containing protein n=1 Tax=Piscinibacter gummiphilus TaxID=946333 RepID=A0ABZ0D229_9BURK|nr:plasmid partitioning protein RepB C-terminal domain-containing protein [Piscinibacter gummiphilus]WOB11305.1 plasmid partitioning protein RepB C-terminal domain-containing protein [Piscinibacter gummiphilus]
MSDQPVRIEMISIDSIEVPNPRTRVGRIHQEITENIANVGLKRPITVRRNAPSSERTFALVCGQGRLESCKALGQATVPAIVLDTDEETGHVMSLVENIARRMPRTSETMEHVAALKARGYSDAEIGKKIGCTASWVNNVANLLEKGEKRLLAAAEAGHIPLHLAVSISRASDADAQRLLLDAYNSGELKGKKISVARRILEQRRTSGKHRSSTMVVGKVNPSRQMTPEDLAKLYQRNAEEHRRIQKRSEQTQTMLLLAQEMFKDLFANPDFRTLLAAEQMESIPQPLVESARKAGLV